MLTLVLVVVFAALVFEFINGFLDTANDHATADIPMPMRTFRNDI